MLRSLTGKVSFGALLCIGLLIGLAFGAIQGATATEQATRHLAETTLVQSTLNEQLVFRLARTMTELVSAAGLGDEDELDEARQSLATARTLITELNRLESAQDDAAAGLAAQREALVEQLEALVTQVETALASQDQPALEEVLEAVELLDEALERLIEGQDARLAAAAASDVAAVSGLTAFARVAIPLQFTVLGLVALLAAWLLHRLVVRPINELARVAVAVGNGQLDQRVPRGGIDEVGTLQGALDQMVVRLRERDAAVALQTTRTQAALAELELRAAEQARLLRAVEQQREAIRGLSVPVLPLGERVLAMPLVGPLDAERLQLVQRRAHTLLIDVTGVPVIDEGVAEGLLQVPAARLLGAEVVMVGIRPEVAQALVGLGLPLEGIRSYASLQAGIRSAAFAGHGGRA